jgi:uncharacterized protein (DUF2141 family)
MTMVRRIRDGRSVAWWVMATAFGTAACSTAPHAVPSQGEPISIRVLVTGARAGAGPVRCAIYRDPSQFMTRDGIWQGASAPAADGAAAFEFTVPAGLRIAVSVFQDLDDDATFDRGPLGIPAEPWGTSGTFSALLPPSWRGSSIVPETNGTEVSIALVGGPRIDAVR